MKRKINGKLLLFSVLILILGIVLLGVMFRVEHGTDSFQAHLCSTKYSFHSSGLRNIGTEGCLGLLAFGLIALGCYGIFKGIQGRVSEREAQFQIPSVGCIVLSLVLILVGCILSYFVWIKGYRFSRRYSGIEGIIFMLLGGAVFYRGMQGKEFRFWHKKWEPLGEAQEDSAFERTEKIICPYCKNKLRKKESYCPICGREL